MPTNSELIADVEARASIETLREVVETLAPLDRLAGTEGERVAAEWLAQRLERAGAAAIVDEEEYLDGFAPLLGALTATGVAAGIAGAGGRARGAATAAGAAATGLTRRRRFERTAPGPTRPGAAQDDLERGRRARRPDRRADHCPHGAPRRGPGWRRLRPDAPAQARRLVSRRDRANRHRDPGLVGRGRRAGAVGVRGRDRPAQGRRRGGGRVRGRDRAARRYRPPSGRPRRQRQPERRRGAGRDRRGAARSPACRRPGAARLVRRRGGAAGRHLRVRRAPPAPARSRPHLRHQLRHDRLAGARAARGRRRVRDRGLLRPRPARPLRPGRGRGEDPDPPRDAGDDQHRLADPEQDGHPDPLPDLAQPPQGARELPLDGRHAGEPELEHGRLRGRPRRVADPAAREARPRARPPARRPRSPIRAPPARSRGPASRARWSRTG